MRALTVSSAHSGNGDVVLPGDKAEVQNDEGGGDGPVDIAGIEELPASSNSSPPLSREHREVGESSHTSDESVAEVILPALSIGIGSLRKTSSATVHHDTHGKATKERTFKAVTCLLQAIVRRREGGDLGNHNHGGNCQEEETEGQSAHTRRPNLLNGCASRGRKRFGRSGGTSQHLELRRHGESKCVALEASWLSVNKSQSQIGKLLCKLRF